VPSSKISYPIFDLHLPALWSINQLPRLDPRCSRKRNGRTLQTTRLDSIRKCLEKSYRLGFEDFSNTKRYEIVVDLQASHTTFYRQTQTRQDVHQVLSYIGPQKGSASLPQSVELYVRQSTRCNVRCLEYQLAMVQHTGSSIALIAKRGVRTLCNRSIDEASR
jgi:hypothetical protein